MLGSIPASAQWPPLDDIPTIEPTGTADVAVIVAIEDYLLLPAIPGAVANANEWEVFLRNGMKVRDVHVLANQNATRESMLKFAKTAAADVGEGGTLWWVFIGHGAPTVAGDDGVLLGMDAQPTVESLASRGLPQGQLLSALQSSNHKTVLVLDTSFSGRAADGAALAPGVQPVIAVESNGYLLPTTVVLSAAKPSEVAGPLDGAARPAFSYLMLGAMRGWADANDGEVTAAEAMFYAQRELRKIKGRQQSPQIAGDAALVLSRGVKEGQPRVVATPISAEPVAPRVEARAAGPDKAALTLEYLQRRVVFEGNVARIGGQILDGPAFYQAIGRPELADEWLGHKPGMWITGIAVTVASSVALGAGVGYSQGVDDSSRDGYFIAGGLVGGIGIIVGSLAIIAGLVGERHPMTLAQRRLVASEHNASLRQARGLGPEVDWPGQAAGGSGPWSGLGGSRNELFGFTLRF